MTITLYVLLRIAFGVQEYLGVFPDFGSAEQHASDLAQEQQNAVLGDWKDYGEDALYSEARNQDAYKAVYIVQAETLITDSLEYAFYDQAVANL